MDDLNLIREFRAERAEEDIQARAEAWRALEARFELAAESAPGRTAPRQRMAPRRRRLFAFAAASAATVALATVVVLDSGPTTQSASARILHETADAAEASAAPVGLPQPGQFYYRKAKRLELESWVPGGEATVGGVLTRAGAFTALVPTTQEWWTAADGGGRVREVVGELRFLTEAERARWEAAGSRLPAPFDPEYQSKYPLAFADALELGRGVVDREVPAMKGFRFPDTSSLPTEAGALREAVEANEIQVRGFNLLYPGKERLDTDETVAQLFNLLQEGNPMTPELRAAVYDALAELPGIEVDTGATDSLGRAGYAISLVDRETGDGTQFIFDPDTAEVLAEREFLGERGGSASTKGIPAGTTIRETAYLSSAVVDSTDEAR